MNADKEFLNAALLGYEQQLQTINQKMEDIRQRLRGKSAGKVVAAIDKRSVSPKKRRLSAEGRARTAAAQKKRWAAARKAAA